jgi:hypothetical protein
MKGTLCPQSVMAQLQSNGQRNTPNAHNKRRMIVTMCDSWWAAIWEIWNDKFDITWKKIAAKHRSLPNDYHIYAKKKISESGVEQFNKTCYFITYHRYSNKDKIILASSFLFTSSNAIKCIKRCFFQKWAYCFILELVWIQHEWVF